MTRATLQPFSVEVFWTPKSLFSLSQTGDWWDFSDNTTMWQDFDGTTPVTALGDPVGRVVGKANGVIATQTSSDARPLWQLDANGKPGLQFDGVDDFLVTPSLFDHAESWYGLLGVTHTANSSYPKAFWSIRDGTTNTEGIISALKSGNTVFARAYSTERESSVLAVNTPAVVTSAKEQSPPKLISGLNLSESATTYGSFNATPAASLLCPIRIGVNVSSQHAPAFMTQLFIRGGEHPNASEKEKLKAFIAEKTGVTLAPHRRADALSLNGAVTQARLDMAA
jgi:hypothetical protein